MKLANFPSNDAEVVELNVGGRRQLTTVGTLTGCSSFFSSLAADAMPTTMLEDGCFFIDRNGSVFADNLEYMRSQWIRTDTAVADLVRHSIEEHALES